MSLRHALLGLLVDRSASGYDLMKLFDTSLGNVWPATQSQVYGELGRLADGGLIDAAAEGPRGRKEYTLAPAGLEELRRWLSAPVHEPPRRSENLLRVFFLGVLSDDQARDYLGGRAERAAEHHARLRKLEEAIDWSEGMLSIDGRLALEYGLRLAVMEEEWALWARDQVGRRLPAASPAPPPAGSPVAPASVAPASDAPAPGDDAPGAG